jgi:uncharacterized protein
MATFKLVRASQTLPVMVDTAHTWLTRLRGLLGTRRLASDRALWLKPCDSIHTMGMLYRIDVVFLDENQCVVKLVSMLKPMRFCLAPKYTESVLELSAGQIQGLKLALGDKLEFLTTADLAR